MENKAKFLKQKLKIHVQVQDEGYKIKNNIVPILQDWKQKMKIISNKKL